MEAEADGQGDLERVLCTIGLDVATVIEEVLQVGLQVDTKMRREVVLQSDAERSGKLVGHVEGFVFLENGLVVVDVADFSFSVYRQFKHGAC